MEVLRCIQADHEKDNKTIEGICIDPNCQAAERIWCVICLKKYHRKCDQDCLLVEQEAILKMVNHKNKLLKELKKIGLEVFQNTKYQLIKQLDSIDQLLTSLVDQSPLKQQINQIESILSPHWSLQKWNKLYNLITRCDQEVNLNNSEIMNNNINTVKSTLAHIESMLLSQKLETQLIQSDWGINDKEQILIKANSFIETFDCSPDGNYVIYSDDTVIRIYDPKHRKQIGIDIVGHFEKIWTIKYSPNGQTLASGSGYHSPGKDCTIRIWDVKTQNQLQLLKAHTDKISCIAFSPDGLHLVSGSHDKTIRKWNLKEGQQIWHNYMEYHDWIDSLDYSPIGQKIVVSGSDFIIRILDAYNGLQIKQLIGHTDQIYSVTYSLDGQQMVSASEDKSIRIWKQNSDQSSISLLGHTQCVNSVSISPDSKLIVSCSEDKTVRLWCSKTGSQVGIISNFSKRVRTVSFSRDGKFVVSGSNDQFLRITDLKHFNTKQGRCRQQ